MNVTHTPGPWRVVQPSCDNPSLAMVAGGNGVTIYEAPLTNETEANAHIIAAAPALLEACKELLAACGTKWTSDDPYMSDGSRRGVCAFARAAIARATGQTAEEIERMERQ